MTLVRLNQPSLVRDLAHEAFFRNFSDSYLEKTQEKAAANKIDYHISEHEDRFILEIAIPGLSKNDVNIELDNGILVVATKELAEDDVRTGFSAQQFSKRFKLSKKVNQDKVSATSNNGLLTISLPKIEEELKKPARNIEIA